MRQLEPRDASIITALAQRPRTPLDARRLGILRETFEGLLENLSDDEAREIGQAVLADDEAGFSVPAQATARQMKAWSSLRK